MPARVRAASPLLAEPIDHTRHRAGLLSRRGVLGLGAAALTAGVAAPALARCAMKPVFGAPALVRRPGDAPAKNLIFLVADGMSAGACTLIDQFGRYSGAGHSALTRLSLQGHVRRAISSTHSATAAVTDSAAASSAWSTGLKHPDGSLCVMADGRLPTPLLMKAKAADKRTGCVTTTTITHATPAGWYANVPDRDLERQIGEQLLERRLDVALGGGAKLFDARPEDGRPHLRVLRTLDELAGAPTVPPAGSPAHVLGLFCESHVPMVLDRPAAQPSLLQMAEFAVRRLSALGSDTGFVLQVEAGRVDHAAHRNDAMSLLREMQEFDRVAAWAAEWTMARTDTLLIITTDHGTANPGLTLYGQDGVEALRRLGDAKHSMDWILSRVPDKTEPPEAADLIVRAIKDATGIDVGARGASVLRKALRGEQPDPFTKRNLPECIVGSLLAEHLGVSWVSPNHTSDHVQLLALGAGAGTLPTFQDNTATHDWIVERLRLDVDAS